MGHVPQVYGTGQVPPQLQSERPWSSVSSLHLFINLKRPVNSEFSDFLEELGLCELKAEALSTDPITTQGPFAIVIVLNIQGYVTKWEECCRWSRQYMKERPGRNPGAVF